MPDETAAAACERRDHGVDVLGAREQDHGRRLLGNLRTDLVEEGVVKMGDVLAFGSSAHGASGDHEREVEAHARKIVAAHGTCGLG
jgi:hypothetical protein